jgi:hypothetical protein
MNNFPFRLNNKYDFISNLNLSLDSTRKLTRLVKQVEYGNDSVLRSSTAKSLSPDSILEGWDKVFLSNTNLLTNTLFNIENDNRSKYGPRSLAIPWSDRRSSVLQYFEFSKVKNLPDSSLIYGRGRLRPLKIEAASSYLKSNTNSGLPFLARKSECKESLLSSFSHYLDRRDPCVLFTRTQEGSKTRNVWGFPIADTLNEMRFYQPLLQYQRKESWRSALTGPEQVDRNITRIIMNSGNRDLLSLDFSSYDATVKTGLQECAFNYISNLFQDRFSDELDYIKFRFNTIGLVTPDGVLEGQHGVPSGSTFTNEVDSIVQFLIAREFDVTKA